MRQRRGRKLFGVVCALLGVCADITGCAHLKGPADCPDTDVPRERRLVSLPPYVIDPPDVLLIDVVRVVPKPPYRIEALDALLIQVTGALEAAPIAGVYGIDPDGTVDLGPSYGKVRVAGLTLDEARAAIESQLRTVVKTPRAHVALSQVQALQQIRGEHLVRPDGTVSLGTYGSVHVAGKTTDQVRVDIEELLGETLLTPKISVDVYSYNSKHYFIVLDGAGYGQQVIRLPITGSDTVLDAISQIYGLTPVSSKHHIWVARPGPEGDPCTERVLPVDWHAITQCGSAATNYQLLPGDRIFVQSDALIHTNNALAKVFAPIERVLGITILGSAAVSTIQQIAIAAHGGTSGTTGTGVGTGVIR
jgi:polysaccharide export outer membrane protein